MGNEMKRLLGQVYEIVQIVESVAEEMEMEREVNWDIESWDERRVVFVCYDSDRNVYDSDACYKLWKKVNERDDVTARIRGGSFTIDMPGRDIESER